MNGQLMNIKRKFSFYYDILWTLYENKIMRIIGLMTDYEWFSQINDLAEAYQHSRTILNSYKTVNGMSNTQYFMTKQYYLYK